MNVRKYAEKDIREYLKAQGKCFIAFSSNLTGTNPTTESMANMPKFKVGDCIESTIKDKGFEKARILGIFTSEQGKFKGRQMYSIKILCGIAAIPVDAQDNYQLVDVEH